MRINELMIGDWVQVQSELNRYIRIRNTFDMDSAILYEPIPLTPEILEKNGWVNQHFGAQRQEWWLDKTKFPIVRYSVNDTLHHNGIVLKFVHQLQQALKVCGIDKEIDLNNTEN